MDSPPVIRSASLLLSKLGIEDPGEIDVNAIGQFCGATIVYEPLEGCEARIIGAGNRAIITVNSLSPRPRQRFSAAHELGHWLYDRGKVAFLCGENNFVVDWENNSPERRANRFARDLLLPRTMFKAHARHRPMTFQSVRELAQMFQTSLTATAIRFVEMGSFPAMLICTTAAGQQWMVRSHLVPETIKVRRKPHVGVPAMRLLTPANGISSRLASMQVPAHFWLDGTEADHDYRLHEESVAVSRGLVLTLLWWQDEQPLVEAAAALERQRPEIVLSASSQS